MPDRTPRSVERFVEREHPRLVGALGLYTGDRLLAEEFAQEALARTCRDWDRISEMQAPGAYAHRVAMNLANSWFRRHRARRRALQRFASRTEGAHHDACGADAVAVRQAVAQLSTRRRTAVVLCFFLGYSTDEAAEQMEVKPATVRSLLHRAKKDLRQALEHTDATTEMIPHG